MSEMVEWLTQILDEDERGWRNRISLRTTQLEQLQIWGRPFAEHMLADIAAKRAIIEIHSPDPRDVQWCTTCGEPLEYCWPWPCDTVKALASAYADRPGHRDEWRVDTPSSTSS